jgi:hypothetical protein
LSREKNMLTKKTIMRRLKSALQRAGISAPLQLWQKHWRNNLKQKTP